MPSLLWHAQWLAFAVVLLIAASIVLAPFGLVEYRLGGEVVSALEYFRSPVGPASVVFGGLFGAVTWGLFRRRTWSRHMLMASVLAFYIAAILAGIVSRSGVLSVVLLGLIPSWMYWYLYHKPAVVAWFAELASRDDTAGV